MDIRDLLAVPPSCRLIEHLSYGQYAEIPALRASHVKSCLFMDAEKLPVISPLHLKAAYEETGEEKESESLLFGKAIHCLLLEPKEFERRFTFYEGRRDSRTKDFQNFLSDNVGKDILKSSGPMSWEWCLEAGKAMVANDVVQPYIECGAAEVTGLAPICDVPCKVRFDWISISENCILDVKTTRDIGPLEFWWSFKRYGYGLQLAMYQHAYFRVTGNTLPVVIVAIENHPPFASVVYSIPDELLKRELSTVFKVCKSVRQALDSDHWPSFASEPMVLAIPDYEMQEADMVSWEE